MIDRNFRYEGKEVNLELAEKYLQWPFELEKRITNDAATAARNSTQLKKTSEHLKGVLKSQQLVALQNAASVTAALARDLSRLKPWAKAYANYLAADSARRQDEAMMERSRARCIADEDAVREAHELLEFFSRASTGELDAFIRSHRHIEDLWWAFDVSDHRRGLQDLSTALQRNDIDDVRRKSMLLIAALGSSYKVNNSWKVGANDFSIWRDAQRDAQTATTAPLKKQKLTS